MSVQVGSPNFYFFCLAPGCRELRFKPHSRVDLAGGCRCASPDGDALTASRNPLLFDGDTIKAGAAVGAGEGTQHTKHRENRHKTNTNGQSWQETSHKPTHNWPSAQDKSQRPTWLATKAWNHPDGLAGFLISKPQKTKPPIKSKKMNMQTKNRPDT